MSISVRRVVEGDLKQLLNLYLELNVDDVVPDWNVAFRTLRSIIDNDNMEIFITEHEGKILSTCTITCVQNLTRGCRPYAFIENVVTTASHRGQGLGSLVIREALQFAWTYGCYKVSLSTPSSKTEVVKLYTGIGFKVGGKGTIKYIRQTIHGTYNFLPKQSCQFNIEMPQC